jgi:hypothetical protein
MEQELTASTACDREGCPNQADFPCSYVDRRRHACATQWCGNHGVDVNGAHFCARHASTVIAVGDEALALGRLPELDNRAPSLVYWVGRDLDSDIPVILATMIHDSDAETLVVDPVALVHGGGRLSERRWERNWKVISHTGISQKVTLQVTEEEPTDIVLRVDQFVVARETPPWVAAREAGWELEPSEDTAQRHAFYARLTDAISAALGRVQVLPY